MLPVPFREARQAVLAEEFAAVGLGDLVSPDLVGAEFFNADFYALAKDTTKLRTYLDQYWSSRSRR